MATHRPRITRLKPNDPFQVALAVLEASEVLTARRQPVTPDTLSDLLESRACQPPLARAQIEHGLAQVQAWRERIFTRDLLDQRRELVAFGAQLQAQQQRLKQDLFYLNKLRRKTDALLKNTLTVPPDGVGPCGQGPAMAERERNPRAPRDDSDTPRGGLVLSAPGVG